MAKTLILIGALLAVTTISWGQQQHADKRARRLMNARLKSDWRAKSMGGEAADNSITDSLYAPNKEEAKQDLDIYMHDLLRRKFTYSISSGYHTPAGAISIKFEDRLFRTIPRLMPGGAIGFSPISGMHACAGLSYFFTGEEKKFVPLANVQYEYASGNRMASSNKTDSFYCITGKGTYVNIAAGIKIKPWQEPKDSATAAKRFESLLNAKVLLGYSFVLQHPGLDSMAVPESGWDFNMHRIRHNISSGPFVQVDIGIDIPLVKETRRRHRGEVE